MKIAIMQPYFLPYIGYFQLMNAVDSFVVYDNIQYTKKGWINRNRILVNGKDDYITLPLKSGSDFLDIRDRYLSDSWESEKKKLMNRIKGVYSKAPYFGEIMPMLTEVINSEKSNLFDFNLNSIQVVARYLEIDTPIRISSEIDASHELKAEKRVISIVKALNGNVYINPIGGIELYQKDEFAKNGIELKFLKAENIEYPQFKHAFVPFLSILDVLMFNDKKTTQQMLSESFSLL